MFSRLFASRAPTQEPNIHQRLPRTPSPAASASSTVVARASPLSPSAKGKVVIRSPSPAPNIPVLDLIESVPPIALHQYLVARLTSPTLTAEEHAALATLFLCPSASGSHVPLVAPPRLHCARCHEDFFECENTTRACRMAHDDESAEVEFVGGGRKETTWKCCGQSVDGEGDLGPPSGHCFEGKHCADRSAARYRHDADSDDDHLDSCERRRCGQRKRGHKRKARTSDPTSISSLSGVSDATITPKKGTKAHEEGDDDDVIQDKRKKKRKVA